jgi:hypothetical protein
MRNTYQDAPTGGTVEARDRRALELATRLEDCLLGTGDRLLCLQEGKAAETRQQLAERARKLAADIAALLPSPAPAMSEEEAA